VHKLYFESFRQNVEKFEMGSLNWKAIKKKIIIIYIKMAKNKYIVTIILVVGRYNF